MSNSSKSIPESWEGLARWLFSGYTDRLSTDDHRRYEIYIEAEKALSPDLSVGRCVERAFSMILAEQIDRDARMAQ